LSDWARDLDEFMTKKEAERKREAELWAETKKRNTMLIAEKLVPALEEIEVELKKRGREVVVSSGVDYASISVSFNGVRELDLGIDPSLMVDEIIIDRKGGGAVNAKGPLILEDPTKNLETVTKEDVIKAVVSRYKDRI
jgi:hypothetical protein